MLFYCSWKQSLVFCRPAIVGVWCECLLMVVIVAGGIDTMIFCGSLWYQRSTSFGALLDGLCYGFAVAAVFGWQLLFFVRKLRSRIVFVGLSLDLFIVFLRPVRS